MPRDDTSPDPEPRAFPRGSIGELCCRVGYDVRDLILEGYTWDEIHAVASGRLSLQDLLDRGPADAPKG